MPVTFSIEGHFESSMYMDRPVPHPRSVAALGLGLMALRGGEEDRRGVSRDMWGDNICVNIKQKIYESEALR